jgi:hypothetical protein
VRTGVVIEQRVGDPGAAVNRRTRAAGIGGITH